MSDDIYTKPFAELTDDEKFEAGGGFRFTDEVAAGMRKRVDETLKMSTRVSIGVVFNTIEVIWLLDAYDKLRRESNERG